MLAALIKSFFTLMMAIWFALHLYIGVRLARPLRGRKRAAAIVIVVLMAMTPAAAMFVERQRGDFAFRDPLRWAGFVGMGFSALLGFWFIAEDLVRLVGWIIARLARAPARVTVDPDRRRFLRNSLNVGVATAIGGVTAVQAASARDVPPVREVVVPISGLHPDLEGFRIAQLTDIHVGPTIRREYTAAIARATNALGADLIAVTGDLVDGRVSEFRDDVAPLRELTAPRGVYFVTGNHEYYWDQKGWLEVVRSFGWDVLLNEHRVLERGGGKILLAGVTDFRSSRFIPEHVSDPAAARAGAPVTDVSILLAHQPKSIFAATAARYDLQISGHTHGGQFFPMSLVVRFFEPYLAGLHRHDDKTWIYVSCGTGYWGPPLRLGVPKEITLLKLVKA